MKASVLVIGAGIMGSHHARICNSLGVLSGIVDTDAEKALSLAKKYGVPAYGSLARVFSESDDLEVNAAVVAVPTPFHLDITKQCFDAGLHVLLEKPMTPSIEEASELASIAEEKGLHLAVGYIENFNPAFRYVKGLVSDSFFGNITSVNIKRVGGIPRSADNVILDLMTHDFGLLMRLLGCAPEEIFVHQHKASDGIVDSAQVLLDFGKTSASCEANWVSPIKIRQMTITGDKGYTEVDLIKQSVTFIGTPETSTTTWLTGEPLMEEVKEFISLIETGQGYHVSGLEGLWILDITLEAVKKGLRCQ